MMLFVRINKTQYVQPGAVIAVEDVTNGVGVEPDQCRIVTMAGPFIADISKERFFSAAEGEEDAEWKPSSPSSEQ